MRLRGHRAADYATMAETLLLALAIELGLRLTSVSALLQRLDRLQPSRRWSAAPSFQLDRFAAAVYRLLPIDATCLRESLVLYALLRRRGGRPKLCVGVKKDGVKLAAHAWIECGDMTTRGAQTSFLPLRDHRLVLAGLQTRRLRG